MQDVGNKLSGLSFSMRESAVSHADLNKEMQFYEYVMRGDIENAHKAATPLGGEGYGILSDDRIRNLRYHLIITVAFITRFCIEGGMEQETAYSLSDIYIRKIDKTDSEKELSDLHTAIIDDFAMRMNRIRKESSCSFQITKCKEYIYNHLNERFTVKETAEHLGISVQYLSRLFHKETGMTFGQYVVKRRIDEACMMLKYSDYDAASIANFLAFSSHSHFIQCFKKETGCTPKQYREKFFNKVSVGAKVRPQMIPQT